MKKRIMMLCLSLFTTGVLFAQASNAQSSSASSNNDATQQAAVTSQQKTEDAQIRQQQMNPFQSTWSWTKSTADSIKEKATPALRQGWSWSKEHVTKIGEGFKQGGQAFYKEVTGSDDKNAANTSAPSSAQGSKPEAVSSGNGGS